MKFVVNSSELRKVVFAEDMTVADAATKTGISGCCFSRLLDCDRTIHLRTAGRLRRAFGDHVVRTMPAQI